MTQLSKSDRDVLNLLAKRKIGSDGTRRNFIESARVRAEILREFPTMDDLRNAHQHAKELHKLARGFQREINRRITNDFTRATLQTAFRRNGMGELDMTVAGAHFLELACSRVVKDFSNKRGGRPSGGGGESAQFVSDLAATWFHHFKVRATSSRSGPFASAVALLFAQHFPTLKTPSESALRSILNRSYTK